MDKECLSTYRRAISQYESATQKMMIAVAREPKLEVGRRCCKKSRRNLDASSSLAAGAAVAIRQRVLWGTIISLLVHVIIENHAWLLSTIECTRRGGHRLHGSLHELACCCRLSLADTRLLSLRNNACDKEARCDNTRESSDQGDPNLLRYPTWTAETIPPEWRPALFQRRQSTDCILTERR